MMKIKSPDPENPLKYLAELTSEPIALSYHRPTFDLLQLIPQKSEENANQLSALAEIYDHPFPAALREWYGLYGVFDIMAAIAESNHPNTFDQPQRDKTYMARYARTAVSSHILPVLFENQGVCHWAVPVDAGDNLPVLVGFQENDFDWHLHAESFSAFIEALTWDFVFFHRNYVVEVSDFIAEADVPPLLDAFERGPHTHAASAVFRANEIQRFKRGDRRILVIRNEKSHRIWFASASRSSLENLLTTQS